MKPYGYGLYGLALTDGPRPLVDPVIDYTAALLMAWGISAALFHRERTGEGQRLDVSLLQAALSAKQPYQPSIASMEGVLSLLSV